MFRLFAQEIVERFHVNLPDGFAQILAHEAIRFPWPGNVRQLRNTVIRSALTWVQSQGSPKLVLDDTDTVSAQSQQTNTTQELSDLSEILSEPLLHIIGTDDQGTLPDFESMQKAYFSALLKYCRGKISGPAGAAELAGIHPNTLRSRLVKLRLL